MIVKKCLSPFYRQKVTEPNLTVDKLINIPYVQDDPMKNDSVPVYKLSKAALNSFSSILAANLKNEGFDNILVNSADPGILFYFYY